MTLMPIASIVTPAIMAGRVQARNKVSSFKPWFDIAQVPPPVSMLTI